MKVLIAGWFSFDQMGATAGDLLTRDLVERWLSEAGITSEVANARPFEGGVDWRAVSPSNYSHVVFVCGPFGNGWPVTDFLERFAGRTLIGLNLTMLQSLDIWNPFDVLLERDSSRASRPELAFLSEEPSVPVVGSVLVHRQLEYANGLHDAADAAIRTLSRSRSMAVVPIDTRLDEPSGELRTAAEVESLIARMDVVLTTRLHGMVLALKNGVPVVAIDPIADGAKIARQALTLGWPYCFVANALDPRALEAAFDRCLQPEARELARDCAKRARGVLTETRRAFLQSLGAWPVAT